MHNFNEEILMAQLTKALENKAVFTSVANNSFTGVITQKNDKVKMNQLGNITISPYAGTTISRQTLTDAQVELIANQDYYFAFDLDKLEYNNWQGVIMPEAMRKAAYAMNNTIDVAMAGMYAQAGIVKNTSAAPVDMTSLNVEDEFLGMAELFAEAGVPREARKFAIIPPWVTTKLTLAGIAAKTQNDNLYAQGYVTTALGWDFIESNNVSKNSASWDISRIICGVYGESFGYAAAVSDVEEFSPEGLIGVRAVKGRYIWGAKIIRPDMTGVLYADKTAEA